MNKIPKLIKRNIQYAFSIIAGLSTIVGLWGYTVKDINEDLNTLVTGTVKTTA